MANIEEPKLNVYAQIGVAQTDEGVTKVNIYAIVGPPPPPPIAIVWSQIGRPQLRSRVISSGPSPSTLRISGTPSPTAPVGVPYAFMPIISGGTGPYVLSLHEGALLSGLALDPTTGIAGDATTPETQSGIVLRVTDALLRTADLAPFSLTSATGTGVNPTTFVAAVAAASPGDSLICGDGNYGSYTPNNTVHIAAPGVSIYGTAAALFDHITITNCSGIAIHGVKVTGQGSNGYAVTFSNSQRITFDGADVDSGMVAGNGIQVRGSLNANISITENAITNKGEGISTLDGLDLLIQGNSITLAGNDGMLITGGTNISVVGNFVGNPRVSAGHPDAIQFSTSFDTGARPTNVLIQYNNFDRGAGAEAQFLFLERSDNITIDSNAGFGSMVNGVALSACNNATVTNNFVQGWAPVASKDIVRGASDTVSFIGNFAASFENYNGSGNNTNITITGNTVVPSATSSTDRTAYLAFLAANPLIPTS